MRRLVCAGLLMGIVSGSLLAQNETYKISGAVIDHATHQPLPKVMVQIGPVQDGPWDGLWSDEGRFTSTDNEGRFAFAHLPSGKYTLLAGRQLASMRLFQGEEGYSTAIAVGPGLDSEHIVFPLPALGAISGTVVDEEGEALQYANVYLYEQRVASGRLTLVNHGSQQTKSSGSFRFGRLQPGTYLLAVQALPWYVSNNTGAQERNVVYPVTYYADATDASSASPITVSEGSTAQVQMALHPVPAIRVRISGTENKPNMSTQVMISALGPGNGKIMVNPLYTTAEGYQELSGIPPGRYELSVMSFENGVGRTVGTKALDLQNGSEVDLSSMGHSSLSGRITFAGGARAPNPLALSVSQLEGNYYSTATAAADGAFQIAELPPGHYQIGINGQNWFHFQSIDVKGGKFKDGFLEIPDGAKVQLSITASPAKTALNGMALRDEKPVPGAIVLLFPEDPDRSDLIRRDQSDSDGTFTLHDVPPGRYRLLAIDNGHGLAYSDPAVIKPYLSSSQTVTVNASKQVSLQVNVQTRLP